MFIFWVIVVFLLLSLTGVFVLYLFAFHNSPDPSKRKKPEDYIKSGMMKKEYEKAYLEYLDFLKKQSCELCYIRSYDGHKLCARYYEIKAGAPVDIMVHGYKGNAFGDFCGVFPISVKAGHNVLLIDQRACGDSEGSVITFGIKERKDCLGWIEYIRKKCGNDVQIFLFGISLGASTVLMTADCLPGNVKGIVSDCGYTSPSAILKKVAKDMKLPVSLCYPLIKIAASLLGGFDVEETSALNTLEQTQIPILFIHGYLDSFVPYTMCGELFDACSTVEENKTIVTFNKAGHASSVLSDYDKYEKAVLKFYYSCSEY